MSTDHKSLNQIIGHRIEKLNQISKDIKGILNNIYKNDKLKIITSLCHDIENKYNIYIDDDTKEAYIKKFVGILNKKKQPKCNKIDVDNKNVIRRLKIGKID